MISTIHEGTDTAGVTGASRIETDELVCSVCHETARHRPPSYYLTSDPDRVPRYSHRDGTALCWRSDGGAARPIAREVRRGWRHAGAVA